MGMYVTVRCNCFEHGLSTEPPLPDDIYFDEHGYPRLGLPVNAAAREYHQAFDDWLQDACDHPGMHYVNVRVSSGAGYFTFLDALESMGRENYPTLMRRLPSANNHADSTSPRNARKMLRELEKFRRNADFGANSFLVDSETGRVVKEFDWDGRGSLCTFVNDHKYDTRIGFNARGVYIIQPNENGSGKKHNRVVFQAKRLEQNILDPLSDGLGRGGLVEYVNRNTGRSFVCNTPIPGGICVDDDGQAAFCYPQYMHVEDRHRDGEYFDYIIEPLTMALEACLDTGNTLVWHESF